MNKTIKVSELKSGHQVKITNRHKAREVAQVEFLSGERVPEQHQGKVLVIWTNCRQWITDPDREVIVINAFEGSTPTSMNVYVNGKLTLTLVPEANPV